MTERQVAIVGAGLAGLVAATTAARAGAAVTVFEARSREGGRARSEHRPNGAIFNEGPHALYAGFVGWNTLRDLGVDPQGGRPALHAYGRWQGRIDRLPGTNLDAVRTRLIGLRAKAQLAKLLANPGRALRGDLSGSLADWIARVVSDSDAAALLAMIGRTATYSPDPTAIAAEAAVPQIIGAIVDGVRYLDGGWQQLVDALRHAAETAGAKVITSAKVETITPVGAGWQVQSADHTVDADSVILASGGPRHVANVLGSRSQLATQWADRIEPVVMASLDLHLAALPRPERRACFALDAPIYFSTHTPAARLAPTGEVVQVAWYGPHDDSTQATLEAFCDEVQPGWRGQVVASRFGRRLVATYGVPDPQRGFAGRPTSAVADCPGVYVAGDWVGPIGLLADAAIASGAAAGSLAARP